jgi:hypothetical protein
MKAACEHFKIHFAVLLLENDVGREIPVKSGEVSGIIQQSSTKKPWWKKW